MRRFLFTIFTSFFLISSVSISWSEPNFLFQTLTTNFVEWFFGKLDNYATKRSSEEKVSEKEEIIRKKEKIIQIERVSEDELVKRNNIFFKKFTNTPFSGFVETYHKNGQLKVSGYLVKGKQNSLWEEYFSNGKKKSVGRYKMGQKDGSWKYYFLNSNIKEKEFYKEGKKDGLWETFDNQGKLIKSESYKNGEWVITTLN